MSSIQKGPGNILPGSFNAVCFLTVALQMRCAHANAAITHSQMPKSPLPWFYESNHDSEIASNRLFFATNNRESSSILSRNSIRPSVCKHYANQTLFKHNIPKCPVRGQRPRLLRGFLLIPVGSTIVAFNHWRMSANTLPSTSFPLLISAAILSTAICAFRPCQWGRTPWNPTKHPQIFSVALSPLSTLNDFINADRPYATLQIRIATFSHQSPRKTGTRFDSGNLKPDYRKTSI